MNVNITANFPGYLISALIVLQYFGSNGTVLDTGFNHTMVLQCLVCVLAVPFLYVINKKKALYVVGIGLFFLLFTAIHYQLVSSINFLLPTPMEELVHLGSYVKYGFYLFVFSVIYYYFEDKDFIVFTRYAKYIVLVLFIESLIFLIFKTLGFSDQAELFDSADGRFAGIFLMHNTLVSLFALFVMSHVVFFGSLREKIIYLTIGAILIVLTGERSAILGLLFLMFAYVLFSHDKNDSVYKDKIKIFFTVSLIVVGFIVLYTMFIRGYDIQSLGEFLRPMILRVYFIYFSIIDLFESNSSIVGFGPFTHNLPTNFADMYSDHAEKFINVVGGLFGSAEEAYLRSWHDPKFATSRLINAHNTFVLLFYKFGYFFVCLLLYFIYLFLVSMNHVRQSLEEIVKPSVKSQEIPNKKEIFFQISSLAFIIASLPALIFLSMNAYLILIAIALGHIGAFVRKLSNE